MLAGLVGIGASNRLALPHGPNAPEDRPPSLTVANETLYPRFDRRRHRYVARCPAGSVRFGVRTGARTRVAVGAARARSGSFHTTAPIRPGQDIEIRAVRGDRRGSYSVRCLPAGFPAWRFHGFARMPEGMFTVTLPATDRSGAWVIVFDQSGTPRWWYSPRTSAIAGQVLPDGTVAWSRSFGDGYGVDPRMAYEVRTLSGRLLRLVRTRGTITDAHEFEQLPNGDVLLDSFVPEGGVDLRPYGNRRWPLSRSETVVFPEVQEIDPSGRLVWRWSSRGRVHLSETTDRWWQSIRTNAHPGPAGVDTYDPFHINSADTWGRQLVVSMRHTDGIYGIDRSSGRVIWKLGGTATPQSLRVIGDPHGGDLFGGQHDARVNSEGRLSFFDNAKGLDRPPRAVWYDLDLQRGTARFVRQLVDPEVTDSHCCGSVRRTSGGWLVDWGRNPLITAFNQRGRIAFRLRLPISSFRTPPVPKGAVSPDRLDRGLEAMEPASGRPPVSRSEARSSG